MANKTSSIPNTVRAFGMVRAINVDTTVTPSGGVAGQIAVGDMIYLTANYQAASLNTPGTTNANCANFIGVSRDAYPWVVASGITENPSNPSVAYETDGEFQFSTTNGDTYHVGDSVYLGANAQTIQSTSSGTSVGVVAPDQRTVLSGSSTSTTLPTTVTGSATQQIVIRIKVAKTT
jgi:hypothetical protein